ncbi:MAG: hypothetical protein IPK75_07315 [Acidobacteria bacterium]|nr:hypothetical protein [Acidobacteriota bacterium]
MLLRRMTQHVKAQNWFAVALDFVIVVTGVFLGIQIGNWNADAALSRKAVALERQLEFELADETIDYRARLLYFRDVQANAEQVLANAEGTVTLSDEDYLIKAFRATQFNRIFKRRYAYDEIVSLGIGLRLKDPMILRDAENYYAEAWVDVASAETQSSTYRRLFREIIPLDVQRDVRRHCGDEKMQNYESYEAAIVMFEPDATVLQFPCQLSLPPERIALAAAALRSADGLERALRYRISELENTNALIAMVEKNMTAWRMMPAEFEAAQQKVTKP